MSTIRGIAALLSLVLVLEVFAGLLSFPKAAEAAIGIDASTPVRWSGTPLGGTPMTSASFTAPANSVLVLCVSADSLATPLTYTISDSGGLQWTLRASRGFGEPGAEDGHVSAYTAVTTSATARTVSVTRTQADSGGTDETSAKLYVVTGAGTASPVATVGEGSSQTNSITPTLFNAAANGSYAFVCGTDWSSSGTPSSSDLTTDGGDQTGISSVSGYKALTLGGAQTANLDAAGAGAVNWNWVALALTPRSNIGKPPNNLGLVGYWNFNEGTSTQATDFSGNGNHGTLQTFASPPTSSSGWVSSAKRGGGLIFDGATDEVIVPDSSTMDITGSFTLSAWIKPQFPGGFAWDDIIAKHLGGSQGNFYFEVGDNDDLACGFGGGDTVTTGLGLVADTWYHVTCVFDTNANTITYYVNGTSVASPAMTAEPPNNNQPVSIGSLNGSQYYGGTLDEVRVYARALSGSEVAALYGSGAARILGSSATLTNGTALGASGGLVAHYAFDGDQVRWTSPTAPIVIDASGNGRNGVGVSMNKNLSTQIGRLGQALLFDGVDDSVSITDNAVFDLSSGGQYSWSGWIKVRTLTDGIWNSIWTQTTASVSDLAIYAHTATDAELPGGSTTNGISVYWFQSSSNKIVTEAENSLQTDTWTHVTVTYDGTLAASSRFKIYVNGQNVTGSSATAGTVSSISPDSINIGSYAVSSDLFNGSIDDVRFYSRLLSSTEVLQLYRLGAATIRP